MRTILKNVQKQQAHTHTHTRQTRARGKSANVSDSDSSKSSGKDYAIHGENGMRRHVCGGPRKLREKWKGATVNHALILSGGGDTRAASNASAPTNTIKVQQLQQ